MFHILHSMLSFTCGFKKASHIAQAYCGASQCRGLIRLNAHITSLYWHLLVVLSLGILFNELQAFLLLSEPILIFLGYKSCEFWQQVSPVWSIEQSLEPFQKLFSVANSPVDVNNNCQGPLMSNNCFMPIHAWQCWPQSSQRRLSFIH